MLCKVDHTLKTIGGVENFIKQMYSTVFTAGLIRAFNG